MYYQKHEDSFAEFVEDQDWVKDLSVVTDLKRVVLRVIPDQWSQEVDGSEKEFEEQLQYVLIKWS